VTRERLDFFPTDAGQMGSIRLVRASSWSLNWSCEIDAGDAPILVGHSPPRIHIGDDGTEQLVDCLRDAKAIEPVMTSNGSR
jgi:hypothetical protein